MEPKSNTQYLSCHCLNVQIYDQSTATLSPLPSDDAYTPVFVGEDGIQVTHAQLTSRSRGPTRAKASVPNDGERAVSLRCLLCDIEVYRVWWEHKPSIDGDFKATTTGPPAVERPETDVLKSRSGWIEVNRACPSGSDVLSLRQSANYNQLFKVVLLKKANEPGPSQSPPIAYASLPRDTLTQEHSFSHLPPLPPLLNPPPFTPSHEAFLHLATVATTESQRLRDTAEAELVQATRQKLNDLEHAEKELRHQVYDLWTTFQDSVLKAQAKEAAGTATRVRSPTRTAAVTRNFTSSNVVSLSVEVAPRKTHRSALSESLRTSGMHYKPMQNTTPPPAAEASAPAVASTLPTTRWDIDEAANIAVSMFCSEMEQNNRKRIADNMAAQDLRKLVTAGDINESSLASFAGQNGTTKNGASLPAEGKVITYSIQKLESKDPRGRKVKFDVESNAVPAPKNATIGENLRNEVSQHLEESIFEFEMENGGSMDGEQLPDEKKPVIQPAAEPRTVRPRGNQVNGKRNQKSAPLSFSALRPSSLPAPSAMQSLGKLKETIHAPSPKVLGSPVPTATTSSTSEASQDATTLYDEPESPTIEGPSKAWQIFTRHQRDKTTFPNGTTIAEEDEDETSTSVAQGHAIDSSGEVAAPPMNDGTSSREFVSGFPRSVPIPISLHLHAAFDDPDYQAKTSLADKPGVRVPKLSTVGMPSSVAIRKAAYAERDRKRGTDPGDFDFIDNGDDGNESSAGEDGLSARDAGDRARQHAFRILKARSELPEAGMWRSLAD